MHHPLDRAASKRRNAQLAMKAVTPGQLMPTDCPRNQGVEGWRSQAESETMRTF
jgi:hypothetical protein